LHNGVTERVRELRKELREYNKMMGVASQENLDNLGHMSD
jgi:hypothetical protein